MLQVSHHPPAIYYTFLQNAEAVFIVVDQSILFHFCQLTGQGAAVNAEVFRQLYPSQRDLKVAGVLYLRLDGKICQEPFPDGSLRHYLYLPHQIPVFIGNDLHHVFNQPMMELTSHGTAMHYPIKGHEEDLCIF